MNIFRLFAAPTPDERQEAFMAAVNDNRLEDVQCCSATEKWLLISWPLLISNGRRLCEPRQMAMSTRRVF